MSLTTLIIITVVGIIVSAGISAYVLPKKDK